MPTSFTWHDVALRLLLDLVAAAIIGINRDERGRPAGFRTNILVSLAACVAMIQTNELINSTGKESDSFVVMDIMRLPLGILSGIGFIGAGAIIKRGDLVVGLTTAATLWYVTVMGLCFGGGQIALGLAAFGLGFLVLVGLKKMELALPREHEAQLTVMFSAAGPQDGEIETMLKSAGLRVKNQSLSSGMDSDTGKMVGWQIRWAGRRDDTGPPKVVRDLEKQPGIERLQFTVTS